MQISKEQKIALIKLIDAIVESTETGLFDVLDVHPDIINNFCDEISNTADQIAGEY